MDWIFYIAIPAFLAQGAYQQRRRDLARAAAMQRHPAGSARRI